VFSCCLKAWAELAQSGGNTIGRHLLIGDGENRGVSAAVLSSGFEDLSGLILRQHVVSDEGNFVTINFVYDRDDVNNAGAIVVVNGSPDLASGFAASNFFAGSRPNFTQTYPGSHRAFWEVVTDEVNEHFYVGFSADGISRVVVGSVNDGFATTTSGLCGLGRSGNRAGDRRKPNHGP